MKKTPNKKRRIVLAMVGIVVLVGTGLYIYQDQQYQQRVADDKQRYESALTDMNKFFDALGSNVTNREVQRTCDYGVGPWGDTGDLNCNVVILAKVGDYSREKFTEKLSVLGWSSKHGIISSEPGVDYQSGEYGKLSCEMTIGGTNVTALCYGRTDFQHYPRVDR